jgi:hypothetical protein
MLLSATVKPFRVSLVEPVVYLGDNYYGAVNISFAGHEPWGVFIAVTF